MPPEAVSNLPAWSLRASVKAPPDVAEEFALEERVGDGSDVDVDERLVAAQRQTVYLAREDILARTVLARDEDVGIGDGDLVDDLPYVCHSLTRAPEHGRGIVAGGAGALLAGVGAERGQTVGVAQRGD